MIKLSADDMVFEFEISRLQLSSAPRDVHFLISEKKKSIFVASNPNRIKIQIKVLNILFFFFSRGEFFIFL